jgi:hypothetical protein
VKVERRIGVHRQKPIVSGFVHLESFIVEPREAHSALSDAQDVRRLASPPGQNPSRRVKGRLKKLLDVATVRLTYGYRQVRETLQQDLSAKARDLLQMSVVLPTDLRFQQ